MSDLKAVEALGLFGERLCLDFTNTTGIHPFIPERNFLKRYDNLVAWAEYEKLLSGDDAASLLSLAAANPHEAEAELQRAIDIREALFRILSAETAERELDAGDMTLFHHALEAGLPHMELVKNESGHYSWHWAGDTADLAGVLSPVVWDAADLLQSDMLHSIRECASESCSWLFLDTSRNHSRRWCDMKSCGNRAKARSHYHRMKDTE